MAQIQETRAFPGQSAGEVYQAILQAAPRAGLEVWKRRDIAWLAMVRRAGGGDAGAGAVDGNISVRPGSQVTVALSAAAMDETALRALAETVLEAIRAAAGGGK